MHEPFPFRISTPGTPLKSKFLRRTKIMSKNTPYLFAALSSVVLSCGIAAGEPPTYTYTPINHPNAKSTSGSGINARGDIVGTYTDQANKTHGFLLRRGDFITIDYPGATATEGTGINFRGDIVGTHQGPNLATPGSGGDIHGFLLRARASLPEPIDYPGHMNTIAQRITASGQILGCYHDHDTMGSMHGMLVNDGDYSALDGTENGVNVPMSMNNGGTPDADLITGLYTDMTGKHRGYVLSGGAFTPFDAPNSVATSAWDMNPSGEIIGIYVDASVKQTHGFLKIGEKFFSIDFPEQGVQATKAFGINPQGDVVGSYVDAGGVTHGFLLTRARHHGSKDVEEDGGEESPNPACKGPSCDVD
jgi:hypothetical protein